ncbi:MAG TPA: hypothetical protein IAD42_05955 [Candidatus Scatomorpha pullistercoris]|uniref:Sigma-54 factor interaction domain-containing protein n=1 Tax=Candidatus Scatomorpha pullistercoris TaxID=2840929 RepID=A0A9D1G551_9FIRM|nr:hypothetical protein [Candidatus Scatomorpha pullistercoris]
MTPQFLTGLTEYDWPGNVRELQNTIERTFYSSAGEELDAQSLRSALGPAPESAPTSHAHGGETGELLSALTLCGGDVGEAAKKLGVSRATLYRHIKRCGIDVKSLR